MILIFFGPPGAGKGTQAELLSQKLKIPHLSTGAILRNKLLDKDSLSKKLKETIDSGNLVSDDILNDMLVDRLEMSDCKNGFILDGYPRTLSQKDFLSNFLVVKKLYISKIFDLKLDNKVIFERIKSRSIIEYREDDKDEIIRTRISKYVEETKPISDSYSLTHTSNYYLIDASQEIEKIQKDINILLKKGDFQ